MRGELLYALGTLSSWAALGFIFRVLLLSLRLIFPPPGNDREGTIRGLLACGVAATMFLFLVALLPMGPADARTGMHIPLVWLVMPFAGWAAVVSVSAAILRCVQALGELTHKHARSLWRSAALWGAAAILFTLWSLRSGDSPQILRGAVLLSTRVALALVALLLGASVAMRLTARAARSRGVARAVAAHAALLAGSALFGLPFLWLLLTSFKEDRDLASADGLVWIPRVQQTLPYFDPKEPILEGDFEGVRVQGKIFERRAGDVVRIDILRPVSLRGRTFDSPRAALKEVPRDAPVVDGKFEGTLFRGIVIAEVDENHQRIKVLEPQELRDRELVLDPTALEPVRRVGLRTKNYAEALEQLPAESHGGLVYLRNTLFLVIMTVLGTLLSSSLVAYGFSRLRFPGRDAVFGVMLATMMLPAAVTLLPTFLLFRSLGWVDTFLPLWVPSFFGSAFNIFLLRQFFRSIPMELEEAAKIDGSGYLGTFWRVMLPQVTPALAVIAIWTFIASWNNFIGPLIYLNSPEQMPISYALSLFQGDHAQEPRLMMSFATLAMLPVLAVFVFAQRYFIEGVTLSGLGGR